MVKYIQKAQKKGFEVELIYLFLEKYETNITRVSNRVLNGGHHVPKDDIIRRFYGSKEMFMFSYKELVDKWTIYYNSAEVFEKIATDEMIYDEEKWQEFKRDIV